MTAAAKLVTKARLASDLQKLGVGEAGAETVMVHTRMSALGRVVGGAQAVVESLLDALGAQGALLVLTGWEDRPPYHQEEWDAAERRQYMEACPPFDARVARAERDHGRVPEAVRTWPGAYYSRHPVDAFTALGAGAKRLICGQSLDEGYGSGSPLERLVEANGAVLVLGAPLDSVTLLHYAEYKAAAPGKRYVEYGMPVLVDGKPTWRRIRELDSSLGAFSYDDLGLEEDAFAVITRAALQGGIGRSAWVGLAEAHLLPAPALVDFAAQWMEARFRGRT